ncbi:MAG: P1 family peptidase, partial [Pseudomonadota bacterium]
VLAGGSVFGLAAGDAVTQALSAQDVGLKLQPGSKALPVVPCAILHDLASGQHEQWGEAPPYAALGAAALGNIQADIKQGKAGAGMGANAGLEPGGIGSASLQLSGGIVVGAVMAANPVGSVRVPGSEAFWAAPWEIDGEFGAISAEQTQAAIDPFPNDSRLAAAGKLLAGGNTTIGVVATNAALSAAQCQRLAMMAQDGVARAVRPAHTPFDGDTIFAVSTGAIPLEDKASDYMLALIGAAAADCTARAIAKAVFHAARP